MAADSTQKFLLGAHVDFIAAATSQADFEALEASIGRPLALDGDYQDWMPTSSPAGFPNLARIAWDKAAGRTIMISWRTDFQGATPNAGCATAADIIAGKYDKQMVGQATAIAAVGTDVLVRWHYEFTSNDDDTCFNNGIPVNSDFAAAGRNYVNSWKHIVDLFRANGANNVRWVWAPAASLFSNKDGSADPLTWTYFYPGDSYVDWIACDRYNKSDTPASFATDADIANFYSQTSPRGKPLMVSETAANNDPAQSPDAQTLWLTTIRTALPAKYPAIRALVWWNTANSDYLNANPKYGGTGYQLVGPGLAAYKALANDSYFGGQPPAPQMVSAASLQQGPEAPGSLVSIFGTGLAPASNGAIVTVKDSAGLQQPLTTLYVSPTQINAVMPATMASGSATFSIVPTGGAAIGGSLTVAPVAPAIFAANANGTGVAAAALTIQRADGSVVNDLAFTCPASGACIPKPVSVSNGNTVYLILYGTGFRNRSSLANTSVSFNSRTSAPLFAGAQGGFAGLDQVNVLIPSTLAGAGIVNIVLTADGHPSNTVTIQVQ